MCRHRATVLTLRHLSAKLARRRPLPDGGAQLCGGAKRLALEAAALEAVCIIAAGRPADDAAGLLRAVTKQGGGAGLVSAGRHAAGLGIVADRDPAAAADAFKRAAAAADSERCVAGRAPAAECRVLAARAAWRAGLTVALSRG